MADNTPIEWTDATWNPITGCSVVSPGCTHCYAMKLAGGRLRHHPSRQGLTKASKAGPVWTGEVRFNEAELLRPLRWRRPRKIFVCAHGDLFHPDVPPSWIAKVFAIAALCPHHVVQVLTKRPDRMRLVLSHPEFEAEVAHWMIEFAPVGRHLGNGPVIRIGGPASVERWPLPNVWLGVSAEDQARADDRIPELLATPAAVRFLSAEPLLGPIMLDRIQAPRYVPGDHELDWKFDALLAGSTYEFQDSMGIWESGDGPDRERLDWVIAGGESGPGARPMHPDWPRQLRDQCANAEVAFHFKQWGAWREFGHIEDGPGVHEVTVGTDEAESILPLVPPGRRAFLSHDGRSFRTAAAIPEDTPARLMERIGKKAAGRLLDGVSHDGFPEPQP